MKAIPVPEADRSSSAPTVPMRPIPVPGSDRSSSAPTVPMRPIAVPKERDASSAPTVPMKAVPIPSPAVPIHAPLTPDSEKKGAAPTPVRAPVQAPRVQPPPAPRPMAPPPSPSRQPPAPAAPAAAPPAAPVVVVAPSSEPSRTSPGAVKTGERAAVRTGERSAVGTGPLSPAPRPGPAQRPAEAPRQLTLRVEEPTPRQAKPPDLEAPRKVGLSTSVAVKANKLHQLLEQAQRDKKSVSLRKGSSRSSRAPFPSVRPDAPAAGASTPRTQSVQAPVESLPGKRTVALTQAVIDQYAVATNPRYKPTPKEPLEAGHLFVFDVMNSLHTTLGRAFATGYPVTFRPGTLGELWKWLSEDALSRGWRLVEGKAALLEAAARGLPIIAMADTPLGPRLAVVEPGPPGPDGRPRLASAHEPRGPRQTAEQLFGSSVVRYLSHE
ncbi:hypothetical protein [Hyalangium gracile]|uniref:hypothetical protein n=1 Tax=Hyalangium gracile TaxID=394092 RepID=UPI001CCB3DA9|nr:hypothetical protein [Hyalangium gracile]